MKKFISILTVVAILAALFASCSADKLADKIMEKAEEKLDEVAESAEEKINDGVEEALSGDNIKEQIDRTLIDEDDFKLVFKSVNYLKDEDELDIVFEYDNKTDEELVGTLALSINDMSFGYRDSEPIPAEDSGVLTYQISGSPLRNFEINSISDVLGWIYLYNPDSDTYFSGEFSYKEDSDDDSYEFLYDKKEVYEGNDITIYDIMKPSDKNFYKNEKDILVENNGDDVILIEVTNLRVNSQAIEGFYMYVFPQQIGVEWLISSDDIYNQNVKVISEDEEVTKIETAIKIYRVEDSGDETLIEEIPNVEFTVNK